MSTDPNKKTLISITYYVEDSRPIAPGPVSAGPSFLIDAEEGDRMELDGPDGDRLYFKNEKLFVPRTNYVVRSELTVVRDRRPNEQLKA